MKWKLPHALLTTKYNLPIQYKWNRMQKSLKKTGILWSTSRSMKEIKNLVFVDIQREWVTFTSLFTLFMKTIHKISHFISIFYEHKTWCFNKFHCKNACLEWVVPSKKVKKKFFYRCITQYRKYLLFLLLNSFISIISGKKNRKIQISWQKQCIFSISDR